MDCDRYPTAEQRIKRMHDRDRCGRCLSSTHCTEGCRVNSQRLRCHFCDSSGSHVAPLCPSRFGGNSGSSSASGPKGNTSSHLAGVDRSTSGVTDASLKSTTDVTSSSLCVGEQSLLSTAMTTISNPVTGSIQQVRLILDSGSHRSYITEQLADELELQSNDSEALQIAVFGAKRSILVNSKLVQFNLGLRSGGSVLINASTTETITKCDLTPRSLPPHTIDVIQSRQHQMADNFQAAHGPPDVLIGSDYFWEFITGASIRTEDGIYLIPSTLGYLLGGRYADMTDFSPTEMPSLLCLTERSHRSIVPSNLCAISTESKTNLSYPDIDEFWQLETVGITDNPIESEDTIAMNQFNDTVHFQDGRYQVSLSWKPDSKWRLPTNEKLARGRLQSTGRRLLKADETIRKEYHNVIKNQLDAGIIERVPKYEHSNPATTIHYLPHHPVVRLGHDTTKVRVVYDASAKYRKDQLSLNECLYRGPVILPDLCGILIRFRLNEVALVADIEKAFLQIGLHRSDRDVTRFFWFLNPDNPDAGMITLRFARVLFGAICSPFLLGAVLQHHLARIDTETSRTISNNIYVDNVITGTVDDSSAVSMYREAKAIFGQAGMNIRDWSSNSNVTMTSIPIEDRAASRIINVLGVRWDSNEDSLQLKTSWASHVHCNTKREILQATASVYDPMGLFQPCTLRAKCFLRELWKSNAGWDEPINDTMKAQWVRLHAEMEPIFEVKIRRTISSGRSDDMVLVVFSDASIDSYATAVYLRTNPKGGDNTWESELIFAKSRLCPRSVTKSGDISIPRLELLGFTIAAKAAQFVRDTLLQSGHQAIPIFLLTDSTCVLGWLRSNKSLPIFVQNRVNRIRLLTDAEFHHVPGEQNPADLATRGLTGNEVRSSQLWWHGPDWLQYDHTRWPTQSAIAAVTEVELRNLAAAQDAKQTIIQSFLAGEGSVEPTVWYPLNINPANFSTFRRLLRVTTWCLKYMKRKLWSRLSDETRGLHLGLERIFGPVMTGNIAAEELTNAKTLWVKAVQHNNYSDIFTAIDLKRQHRLANHLNVGVDDAGILRCFGRLKHADLPFDSIQPVLLARNDRVTDMIIAECHETLFHSGVSHTLCQIRRQFWVPQGRHAVRKVITRCRICRRLKGPPFALPHMPPWPKERLSESAPFQFTGVDYFGPVNVSVNEVTQKMWVCLFTCLAVRAVHLEHVMDCTAQCFVDCLSRFISRRGCPELIISDHGPQFRLASTLLDSTWRNTLNDATVQSYVADKGIRWKFTTELAPWQGGFYERLVGIVKTTFRSVVGRKLLLWDHFITLITEAEAIVNSRPLTYVCSDIHSGVALRPMDFLIQLPSSVPTMDPTTRPEGGEAGKNLIRYWKAKQRRLTLLWKQWYNDYLLNLREKGGNIHRKGRSDKQSTPTVGEIVVVKSADTPRGAWKLGRIINIVTSGDGSIRSAELVLPNRQVIRRAINHLFSLEIPSHDDTVTTNETPRDNIDLCQPPNTNNYDNDDGPFDGFSFEDVYPHDTVNTVCDDSEVPPSVGSVLRAVGRRNILTSLHDKAGNLFVDELSLARSVTKW